MLGECGKSLHYYCTTSESDNLIDMRLSPVPFVFLHTRTWDSLLMSGCEGRGQGYVNHDPPKYS